MSTSIISNVQNFFKNLSTKATGNKSDNNTQAANMNRSSFDNDSDYERYLTENNVKLTSGDALSYLNQKAKENNTTTQQYAKKMHTEWSNKIGTEEYLKNTIDEIDTKVKNDENYQYSLVEYKDANGNVISGNDYKTKVDNYNNEYNNLNNAVTSLNKSYENGEISYADYVSQFNVLKGKSEELDKSSSELGNYSAYYNDSLVNEYETNKERMSEIVSQSASLKTNGGSNEERKKLNDEYLALQSRNAEIKDTVDDIKALKNDSEYTWLKENGTEQEIKDFEEYQTWANKEGVSGFLERRALQLNNALSSQIYGLTTLGEMAKNYISDGVSKKIEKAATELSEKGYLSEDGYNALMETSQELQNQTESEYAKTIREFRDRINLLTNAGDQSTFEQYAGQAVDGAVENTVRFALLGGLGEVGVTVGAALPSMADQYNSLKQQVNEDGTPKYSESQMVLSAGLHGYLTMLTEFIPTEKYFDLMATSVGQKISREYFAVLAQRLIKMVPEEMLEEAAEYGGDFVVDKVMGIENEWNTGELFKQALLAGASTMLSAVGGSITTAASTQQVQVPDIENEHQYNDYKVQVNKLKISLNGETDASMIKSTQEVIRQAEIKMAEYEEKSATHGAVTFTDDIVNPISELDVDTLNKEADVPDAIALSEQQTIIDEASSQAQNTIKSVIEAEGAKNEIKNELNNDLENKVNKQELYFSTEGIIKALEDSGLSINVDNDNDFAILAWANDIVNHDAVSDYVDTTNKNSHVTNDAMAQAIVENYKEGDKLNSLDLKKIATRAYELSQKQKSLSDVKYPTQLDEQFYGEKVEKNLENKISEAEKENKKALDENTNGLSKDTAVEPFVSTKDIDNYEIIKEGKPGNISKNEYTNKEGILKTEKLREDAGSDFKGTTWAEQFENGSQAVEAIQKGVEEGESLDYIVDEFMTANQRPIVAQEVAQYLIDNQETELAKKVAKKFMNEQLSEAASVLQEGRALKDVNNQVTRMLIVDSMRNNMLLEAEQTFKGDKLAKAKEAINTAFDDNEYAAIKAGKGRAFRNACKNLWLAANTSLPKTLGGTINRIRYFSMLSGVKTPISNLLANLSTTGLYKVDDFTRTVVESIAKVPQEKRTSTLKLDSETTKKNLDIAEEIWNLEGDTENKYNITGNTFIEKIQKKLLSDTGIEKWNFKNKLNLIAQARGIDLSTLDSNPVQANEIIDWALDQASEVVSHNKTALSQSMDNIQKRNYKNVRVNNENILFGGLDTSIKKLKESANNGNLVSKGFDSFIRAAQQVLAPFYRTNASVLNKAIEHSPLEVVNLIGDYSKVKNGSMSTTDYFNNLSKCLTGTGIMAISALLSSAGLLRWDKEDEDYSGRLVIEGDNGGYTVDWLDPISNMVARGVMVAQEMAEHGVSIEGLTDVIGNEIDMLVNDELSMFNSLMQVATNLKDAVIDKENEYGEYGLGDFVGHLAYTAINQVLPALLRDAARVIYPEQKQVYTDNVVEYVVNRLQNNTLFRDSLENKTNAQGDVTTYTEPYTNNDIINRIITNFISKGHIVDEDGNKVFTYEKGENNNLSEENTELYNELARLNPYVQDVDGYSAEHWLRSSTPSTFYFNDDQSVALSGDEKTKYGNEWSSIWTTGGDSVMSSSLYSTLSDDNKVDVLYKVQSYATGAEAYKYAIEHNIEPTDYQKRCNSIIEYCTKDGELDGETFALIVNSTATDNSGKRIVRKTDESGETIKNSSALLTRKAYEEAGIYESLCEMIEDGGYDYGDFGLNKTVVKMDDDKFNESYNNLEDSGKSQSNNNKEEKDTLTTSYTKVMSQNKAIPETNSSKTSTNSLKIKSAATSLKNGSNSNTFSKAYSKAFSNDSNAKYCANCGGLVKTNDSKCPNCGNAL